MIYDIDIARDYVKGSIANSYGNTAIDIMPFTANLRFLLQSILVGKVAFFGDIDFNLRAYMVKNPAFLNPALGTTDLFFSLNKVPQLLLSSSVNPGQYNTSIGAWSSSNEILKFNDILFDDLVMTLSNYFMASNIIGSVAGQVSNANFQPASLSTLLANGNSTYASAYWATIIASNPNFIYAPEMFYFKGYKVSFKN